MAPAKRLPMTLRAYRFVSAAVTPLAPAWLGYRTKRGKENPERVIERRGETAIARPDGPLIWVHGASVGELLAILPLVERLRAMDFARAGHVRHGDVRQSRARPVPADVIHQFIPLDTPRFVAQFLNHWQPILGLVHRIGHLAEPDHGGGEAAHPADHREWPRVGAFVPALAGVARHRQGAARPLRSLPCAIRPRCQSFHASWARRRSRSPAT